jgi:hypothetical protein
MKTFNSQTYFNRTVNYASQYDPDDFIDEMNKASAADADLGKKIETFMDKVAQLVEEALQSNELINVF